MSDLLDPRVAAALAEVLAKNSSALGARDMLDVLRKVAPTAGSRITDLRAQAEALSSKAGVFTRIGQGLDYMIRGVTPTTWFGPGQPIAPQAQKPEQGAVGRRLDYGVSQNIQFIPKTEVGQGIPFYMLRNLREAYDLVALAVETRKDQAAQFEWEILPREEGVDKAKFKDQVKKATTFFERPNREDDFSDFLRQIVDDSLVCDGVALYPRKTRGGDLFSITPIDAPTIKLLVDESGMRPEPPSPAFQQVMKGVPAVDYTSDDLLYWRRNRRTNRVYGYSPVEQVITTINIGLRRQSYQLEYYTEGNIPDSLLGVPDTWTPEQITEFQDQFDEMLAGNTGERRKARFVPGDIKALLTLKDTQVALTDAADEWFARVICFAFSIAPIALLKMVNRAAGQQIAQNAKEEGNIPYLNWLASKFTQIIQDPKLLNCPDVKFAWQFDVEVDPQVKAQIRESDVRSGIRSIDEARREEGLQPRGVDDLIVMTPTGPVPVKETLERARQDAINPPQPPAPFGGKPGAPPAKEGEPPKTNGKPVNGKPPVTVQKGDGGEINVHIGSPIIEVHTPPVRTEIKADLRPERERADKLAKCEERPKIRKARARRDPVTGDLQGEFWDEDEKLERRVTLEHSP